MAIHGLKVSSIYLLSAALRSNAADYVLLSAALRSNAADYVLPLFIFLFIFLFTVRSQKLHDRFS